MTASEPINMRSIIVDNLKATAQLRASYSSKSLPDALDRAFRPLADAGKWNRSHPEHPITKAEIE